MNRKELRLAADSFLKSAKDRVAALSRAEIETWPEWPQKPPFSIDVPQQLSEYEFTLMKDTLPNGRIRIAIQGYRYRFLGMGEITADGLIFNPDGSIQELSQQDLWDVT